jgi:hypothetical protein
LVKDGRHDEAIAWCQKLKESGAATASAIDAVLFELYGSGGLPSRGKSTEGVESLLVPRRNSESPQPACDLAKASVDELLAAGYLATAVELLENQIQDHPTSFDLYLKLAEAHASYCRNFHLAGKVIRQIESNPAFTPQQILLARSRLKEWQGKSLG